jgi:hypothetical protein
MDLTWREVLLADRGNVNQALQRYMVSRIAAYFKRLALMAGRKGSGTLTGQIKAIPAISDYHERTTQELGLVNSSLQQGRIYFGFVPLHN